MTNWALAGRWFWHLREGKVFHQDIALAAAYRNELLLGWFCHYAVGVTYAGIFILILPGWPLTPTILPAWIFAILTILPGWFLMQPGMGAGIASSRRPNHWQIRCLNIISHSVFAVGLYGMALLIR